MRTPTAKQYDTLLALGGGAALVVGGKGKALDVMDEFLSALTVIAKAHQ